MAKKVKNIVLWTYGKKDINSKETVEIFYGKELQIQIKPSLELKKVKKELK